MRLATLTHVIQESRVLRLRARFNFLIERRNRLLTLRLRAPPLKVTRDGYEDLFGISTTE